MERMLWLLEYLNTKSNKTTQLDKCCVIGVFFTSNQREIYMEDVFKSEPMSTKLGKGIFRMYIMSCTDIPCYGVYNTDLED